MVAQGHFYMVVAAVAVPVRRGRLALTLEVAMEAQVLCRLLLAWRRCMLAVAEEGPMVIMVLAMQQAGQGAVEMAEMVIADRLLVSKTLAAVAVPVVV
jgi:hypothetical protein